MLVGVAAWLSWQPQSWYDPPEFTQPEVVKLADRAEHRLNEEFHKVRPVEDVWRLRIGDDAMNSWLVGRLEGWLTHDQHLEMPSEVHQPQVHVTPEGVWIAAMIEIEGNTPRPLAIQLGIWVEDGIVFVEPIAVRLGRIPVPISLFQTVVDTLRQESRGIKAIVPLMDDREVEILDIEFEQNALILTCKTLLPQ